MIGNNNVGKNEGEGKVYADIHFDLAATAGTDLVAGFTGVNYDPAALLAIAVARGAVFSDGTPVAATDTILQVEADLKPIGGQGIHEGDEANGLSVSTTSQAFYKNNGSTTDIDSGGGRGDNEGCKVPSTFTNLFVCNDSIVTVYLVLCKDAAPVKP